MSDKPDNSSDRLEGLLRRWGADEAARNVETPPPPAMAPARRAGPWAAVQRWGPLAAAAGLLIAAGGLYVAADLRKAAPARPVIQEVRVPPAAATAPGVSPAVEQELGRLKARLAEARRKLDEETRRFEKEIQVLKDDLKLRDTTVQAKETEIASLKVKLDERAGELAAAEKQAQAAKEQAEALRKDKAALAATAEEMPKLQGKLSAVEARVKAATEEIARAGQQREAVEEAYAKAQGELALLKLRRGQTMSAFRQIYLAAAAPGETGLGALQTAARTRRLVERCAELHGEAQTEPTRRLLARLEVVLTRLDLLDPASPIAAGSFARLVAQGGLAREVDDALAAGNQPQPVRNLLLEAGFILAGAEHAT